MKERLISGQCWFSESGDIILEAVVDVQVGSREASYVMIDGVWFPEEEVQRLVSGCRNDVYETVGEGCSWKCLEGEIDRLQNTVRLWLEMFRPSERSCDEVIEAVIGKVSQDLVEEGCWYRGDGGIFLNDNLVVFIRRLVETTVVERSFRVR